MTPKKLKLLLILAIVCIVLFGALFRIMTKAEQTPTQTAIVPQIQNTTGAEEILIATTGTITEITGQELK